MTVDIIGRFVCGECGHELFVTQELLDSMTAEAQGVSSLKNLRHECTECGAEKLNVIKHSKPHDPNQKVHRTGLCKTCDGLGGRCMKCINGFDYS